MLSFPNCFPNCRHLKTHRTFLKQLLGAVDLVLKPRAASPARLIERVLALSDEALQLQLFGCADQVRGIVASSSDDVTYH